jgi:chromate transporter
MTAPPSDALAPPPTLGRIAREWTRIGVIGFGGPPAHIVLLRELVVERERWIDRRQFEDAIAATGLIPGPASTQLAIYCARVLGGPKGALVGAAGFILPGLVAVVALAAVFLAASPPLWILAAGAGAGAAVPTVALHAGLQLLPDSRRRAGHGAAQWRWMAYALAGSLGAAAAGAYVVLVLLGAGLLELAIRTRGRGLFPRRLPDAPAAVGLPIVGVLAGAAVSASVYAQIMWTAFKVGALAYGGGFVVIPLMRSDAVEQYGWMTDPQFLSAVAIGQVTPGPVTNTVAAVGWSAAGIPGALLAGLFAFGPSVVLIAAAGHHFERIRQSQRAQAFLLGSGPAALGAILGSCVPLAMGLTEAWQWAVLAGAAVLLLSRRLGLVTTLLLAAAVGVALAAAGAPIPR